jgi:hypothetical protein
MSHPNAADYSWFRQIKEFSEGFSLTWVANVDTRRSGKLLDTHVLGNSGWGPSVWKEEKGRFCVGITHVANWSLLVNDDGQLTLDDAALVKLSANTMLVSHCENVNLDSRYVVYRNGIVQTEFDPHDPDARSGSEPDVLTPSMKGVGFLSEASESGSESGGPDMPGSAERALALTETITKVPLTAGLLRSSRYLVVTVSAPQASEGSVENQAPAVAPS